MKTIGLIGGMSWQSTAEYYRILNEEAARRLGGGHSAKILLYSFDFQELLDLMEAGQFDEMGQRLRSAGQVLLQGGAELLLLCSNTVHAMAASLEDAPLLHLVDVTAKAVLARGFTRVGLLGTRYTMEQDFYSSRLASHGVEMLAPENEDDRVFIHRVITDELTFGLIREDSRLRYIRIMEDLMARGAEGVILGCTEIPLLVQQQHTAIPLFDTTRLHALAAVDIAIA